MAVTVLINPFLNPSISYPRLFVSTDVAWSLSSTDSAGTVAGQNFQQTAAPKAITTMRITRAINPRITNRNMESKTCFIIVQRELLN